MRPLPISREEFARFFQKSKPPSGWPARIGIGNSGGADSTCLLFLVERYFADSTPSQNIGPKRVYSLTIDHALQECSADMAAQAARVATSLHVPHTTTRIPWGIPPFPLLPEENTPFERTARKARYHLYWKWMQREDIGAIALGHHADDQVETALMRFGRGTSELGGRGMLPYRRWGMGVRNELEWTGHEGMSKWVIRPLLEVSKDRIYATCEENELTYATDPTNFQPQATIRNALRAIISKNAAGETPPDPDILPPETRAVIETINTTIDSISHLSVNLTSSPERLRAAVKTLGIFANDIENQATSQIEKILIPSPPGVAILSPHAIQAVTNPLVRRAIVLRILRYVSFHPWGNFHAQAKRRQSSLDQIISKIWSPDPFDHPSIRTFAAGGGVLWSLVIVDTSQAAPNVLESHGRVKRPNPDVIRTRLMPPGQGMIGWMASRQPPPSLLKDEMEDTLNVDVTVTLLEALWAWDEGRGKGLSIVEILWDCRYLIKFDLAKMPQFLKSILIDKPSGRLKIIIRPWTQFFLPKIVMQNKWAQGDELVLHSTVDSHKPIELFISRLAPRQAHPAKSGRPGHSKAGLERTSTWIHTSWARIMDPY